MVFNATFNNISIKSFR